MFAGGGIYIPRNLLNYYGKNVKQGHNKVWIKYVAEKADRVKFKGTMTIWPVQTKKHNENHT